MRKAKIGLTAGIGCGKSLIARVFENLGISVFYSDKEAKRLYDNPLFLQEIVRRFGEIVIENGEFQARKLADIVFNDRNKLQELNELIHPKVFEIFDQWSEKQKSPYVIMESAILFENGLQTHFDKIISISTPEDIVIRRVMARDACSKEQVCARMSNQMPQNEKNALADYLIVHDDSKMLIPQILNIHTDILKYLFNAENQK